MPFSVNLHPPVNTFHSLTSRQYADKRPLKGLRSCIGIAWITVCAITLAAGLDGASAGTFDGPAELPRIHLKTSLADTPAPGKVLRASSADEFRAALDKARCGDTIALQSGATFEGPFRLPAKACDDSHWIIIRTSAADSVLPPENTRLTPCYAGVSALQGRPDFKCASTLNVLAQLTTASNVIVLLSGANHYRFLGLEITRTPRSAAVVALVTADTNAVADHIVFDRVWVHGTTHDETRRGIALRDMAYAAVVDSYFSDFHCTAGVGACVDAQAISGSASDNPDGPYKIEDNFIEAAGEGVMFASNQGSTNPSDIEIRRNHFFKPMQWMPGADGFVGGAGGHPFVVKNHFELKAAQRVLFEGNVLENNWGGFTQSGFSIVLTPRNTNHNQCRECQVTDVTIRYNTISHVGAGITMATALNGKRKAYPALAGARYSIHDITVDDISASHYNGTGSFLRVMNAWSVNPLNSISVMHVTAFPDVNEGHLVGLINKRENPPMWGFVFTNNIVGMPLFAVVGAGGGPTNCADSLLPVKNLEKCLPNYIFTNNALIGTSPSSPPSTWPDGNNFPDGLIGIQFAKYAGQNYRLLPSSPFKNAGTDGKDLGADIGAVETAIAGVY